MHKNGFGINNVEWSMCHKTKPNKTKPNQTKFGSLSFDDMSVWNDKQTFKQF